MRIIVFDVLVISQHIEKMVLVIFVLIVKTVIMMIVVELH